MDTSTILSIVMAVLFAAAAGLELYFRTKGSASKMARELIAFIENSGLTGSEKMSYVVESLYNEIPAPLRTIFTVDRLRTLAQEIFDTMKQYALKYIDQIEKRKKETSAGETDEK